jgi:SAM-dependent methyltransferase
MDDLEYTGLMAEAWDALRGDTSDWEDRAFFLDLIRERGEPVLDVGCGTGRLLLDFLGIGIDIDGLEISPDMLAILRSKAAAAGLDLDGRIHEGSMQRFALPRRYRTVIVPSSSFQLLLGADEAVGATGRFVQHLLPGGTLAMPFIRLESAYDERWTAEASLPDGTLVRRTARATFDPATGFEDTDDRWDVIRDGEIVRSERKVRSPATRAWSLAEIAELYARAGLVEVNWYSGFTRQPMRDDDEVTTVVGRLPG